MSVDRECSENRRRHREAVTCSVVTKDFFFSSSESQHQSSFSSPAKTARIKRIFLSATKELRKIVAVIVCPNVFLSIVFFLICTQCVLRCSVIAPAERPCSRVTNLSTHEKFRVLWLTSAPIVGKLLCVFLCAVIHVAVPSPATRWL